MRRVVCVALCVVLCGSAMADTPARSASAEIQRVGQLAKVRPDRVAACKQLLAQVSLDVKQVLRGFSIQNYSIYLKELEPGQPYLFAFFEYTGDDFRRDWADLGAHARIQEWRRQLADGCLEEPDDGFDSPWMNMREVFYFAGRDDVEVDETKVQRHGRVIGVRPEMVEGYNQLHAHPWKDLLHILREGNLRNYPIYMVTLAEKVYIFGYFEYVGKDFDRDMNLIGTSPVTLAWTKFTDEGCQLPLATRQEGEWWASMEEIFYLP